ncbi:MAG: LytTR family transcriptional regulator DNA-binding domain-containing protein [Ignavibacteriales bacterium]|nr:LytTR family transcriptional regulator DNA-binding domain-containing protein [Ignavibacteriales bacterium]
MKANEKKELTDLSQETLTAEDQVFVKDGEKCWFVKLEKVRLMESEGNYVRLYFDENKPLILRTLNYLDERLRPQIIFPCKQKTYNQS